MSGSEVVGQAELSLKASRVGMDMDVRGGGMMERERISARHGSASVAT